MSQSMSKFVSQESLSGQHRAGLTRLVMVTWKTMLTPGRISGWLRYCVCLEVEVILCLDLITLMMGTPVVLVIRLMMRTP